MTKGQFDLNNRYSLLATSSAGDRVIVPLWANPTTHALLVSQSVVPQPTPPTAIVAFVTDVPTAGTAVQLASNAVNGAVIQAPSTNTGNVYIGGSDVSSTVFGAELQPGQMVGLAISNTNIIYIDAATNGDDVSVLGS